MQAPEFHDFFTTSSIVTFAGATGVIWVLSNTIRLLTKRNPLIILFLLSIGVAYLGAYVGNNLTNVVAAILTLINGCLLFCTTAGFHETGANLAGTAGSNTTNAPPADGGPKLQSGKPVTFLSSWFD